MSKFIFLLPLLFTLSTAVLYGSTSKPDFTQGYRYNRPAPHYLPPYQETSTQTSSYYPQTTSTSGIGNWQQSWLENNYETTTSGLYDAPSRVQASVGKPGMNNFNKFESSATSSNGYHYVRPEQSSSSENYKPSSGYNYLQPSASSTSDAYKPSSGYNYLQPTSSGTVDSYHPGSGYNYMKPQLSSSTTSGYKPSNEYNYKPANNYLPQLSGNSQKYRPASSYLPPQPSDMFTTASSSESHKLPSSYLPPLSSPGRYEYMPPQSSISIFEAYKPSDGYNYIKPQSSVSMQNHYNKPSSSSYNPINSPDSTDNYQRPNYDNPFSDDRSEYNQFYNMPWDMSTKSEKASSPSRLYLPPKREFGTPYLK